MRYSLKQFITAMKKVFLFFGLALLSNGSALFAQSTATTTPVGFISETVNGGTLASPRLTLLSPTLTQPIVFQGTIASISGTTINVNGANWTAGQFNGANGSYYVEVFSATKPGALSDITGTGSSSVTTAENLTAFASAGDFIAIRKHITISDFLGANNTYGLLASNSPTTADEVLIYDGSHSVSYFYFTGDAFGDPPGWYDSAFTMQADGITIAPHEGVIIKRKAAGNLTIVSTGTVKTGNTLFPVYNGLNVLGTLSAQGLTLGNSGLYTGSNTTGVTASNSPTTADEVIIYSGTGQTSYFYFTGDAFGDPPGWYDSAFTVQADNVVIAPGTAFVVKRKNGGVAFNWALPSPASF